ncbi:MAG TPA: COR domain-containing protein [Verrucomicrobiales bacterium]|jgi:GTPase SAR1 family protein|nr:COR domain-containing protein [Verrucomicrobiales bacterium]
MNRAEAYRKAEQMIEAARLSRAKELDLSGMGLTELPESLGKLTQLEELNLYSNELTALPESLSQLTQLRKLRLFQNKLSSVPESFRGLKNLRLLFLNANCIEVLPAWIAELVNLEELQLDGNKISTLDESLGNLRKLRELFIGGALGGNLVTDLPASIKDLQRLHTLDLTQNPLNPELAAAYEEGLNAVKRYLRAKDDAQVVLNEAKLILVGEGEVGKSALLGALRGDDWMEKRDSTHGIEIKLIRVTNPQTGTEITLNGWDFGGQRVYRPTHQLFFSAPAVYLVVWKPREGPQQGFVKDWIKLVKHREPDARILVVATHGGPGARQPDINRQEIWDLSGKETVIDFLCIESKPPTFDEAKRNWVGQCKGIEELKDAIAKLAVSLPEVGRSVPKRWQEVREALKHTRGPYLPLDRVLAICGDHKMSEQEAYDFIRISHRLGHLIYYGHDNRLKDMVILKPDWLATAMSFVLDDEETRKNHGLVKFTRLAKLWSDKSRGEEFRYPPKVHPLFVALMERFDLSYRVAGAPLGEPIDETILIAQLVPDVRPETELAREWPAHQHAGDEEKVQICRIVDMKGQSSPAEGLFYQLIVRLHKFSLGRENFDASVHWQRGLILDDDYNGRALLEHIGNDVRITVRAAFPSTLLAVLTREVKWLVENFWEGLRCEVVVPCIEPCGKKMPGTGLFEVQKLIAFKRQGVTLFPCNVSGCDQLQNMECLLQNAPSARKSSLEILVEEGFGDMRSRLDELRQQNLALDQNLKRIMSQVEDAFRGLMQMMTDEGKDGPRLFSLLPVERSRFNPIGWVKKRFRVTLWCEHTRLPLPLINNNDQEGVYEFDVTREWFSAAAPYLKVLTGTLSLMLPVAASATKLILDEATYKSLEDQLDFGKDCADAMLDIADKAVEWLAETERPGVVRAQGGALREFQEWLKNEDPGFGDLRKVLNKQKEFLWVHRAFEKEY